MMNLRTFPALVLLLILYSGCSFAQKYSSTQSKAIKDFETARAAFDNRNYDLAITSLKSAIQRDPAFVEAYFMCFEVYSEMRRYDDAHASLSKGLEVNPDFYPAGWFFLGSIDFGKGRYREAQPSLNRYLKFRSGDPEMRAYAQKLLDNCEFAILAMERPVAFNPVNLGAGVNTSMPEYYPAMTADGESILFTRLVNDPNAHKGKQEDFFVSRKIGDAWVPSVPLRDINTSYNEGAPTLSADGRTLIFTACDLFGEYGEGRKGYGSCDLFISRKVGNRWTAVENLGPPVNTRNWETQPSLSADGRTLYFIRGASTREGIKNQDIMVTRLQADGTWSTPQSVSPRINTPGKEESVMIHPDGNSLYFASNGHTGMGSMDLYVSYKDDKGNWQDPINLGYPVNTHEDENSIFVAPDGVLALFASSREGGFGELDLYSYEMPPHARPTPVTYARGIVTDGKSGEPLAASLSLYDVGNEAEELHFDSDEVNGSFLIALPTGRTYALSVSSPGYLFHSETFVLDAKDKNEPYDLTVKLYKPATGTAIVLKNIFFDTDKDLVKGESAAELNVLAGMLKEFPTMTIEIAGHTDNQGSASYNQALSQRRSEAVKSWLVANAGIDSKRITTKGYGAQNPIATNETDEGRAMNRRTEFKVTGL